MAHSKYTDLPCSFGVKATGAEFFEAGRPETFAALERIARGRCWLPAVLLDSANRKDRQF